MVEVRNRPIVWKKEEQLYASEQNRLETGHRFSEMAERPKSSPMFRLVMAPQRTFLKGLGKGDRARRFGG